MHKIALTGATSMLGLALIRQCIQNNIKVIAFVRSDSSRISRLPASDLLKVVDCNLDALAEFELDKKEQEDTEVFYHFGWSHTDKQGRLDCDKQLKNLYHTLVAVRLAKRIGCRKFIGAGSQAEYGRSLITLTSSTPVNPENAYGISKYAAGKFARTECEKLGLDYVWVRILSVYGIHDNDNTLISNFIFNCKENRPMRLGSCTHVWDYLYEDDAGKAFFVIGGKGLNGKIYCLGSGSGRPLREYLEIIKNMINPTYIPQYGEIPCGENSIRHLCADISELTNDTGWKPEVSFEEGSRRMVENYMGKNIG